jgi:hypothetical protein
VQPSGASGRWAVLQLSAVELEMPEQEARAVPGSIVLAADDPAALARFYGALIGVESQPGLRGTHWRLPWPADTRRATAWPPAC